MGKSSSWTAREEATPPTREHTLTGCPVFVYVLRFSSFVCAACFVARFGGRNIYGCSGHGGGHQRERSGVDSCATGLRISPRRAQAVWTRLVSAHRWRQAPCRFALCIFLQVENTRWSPRERPHSDHRPAAHRPLTARLWKDILRAQQNVRPGVTIVMHGVTISGDIRSAAPQQQQTRQPPTPPQSAQASRAE